MFAELSHHCDLLKYNNPIPIRGIVKYNIPEMEYEIESNQEKVETKFSKTEKKKVFF